LLRDARGWFGARSRDSRVVRENLDQRIHSASLLIQSLPISSTMVKMPGCGSMRVDKVDEAN
jgi:hypothetical protein